MSNEIDISKKDLVSKDEENGLSLSQKLTIGLEEIKVKKDLQKKIFLLDVSGSMDQFIDGKSKLEHLRSIMRNYTEARKVCFSSDVYEHSGHIPEYANGTTDLARAINYLRQLTNRPNRIVLVSDGEPDSQDDAMSEAILFSVPIDIIFIGQKGSSGERFMINLARATKGKEFTIEDRSNINFQKQLSGKIAGLLTSGSK